MTAKPDTLQKQHSHYKLPYNFGLGGVPIGNGFNALSDVMAEEILESAWTSGVRYFDTSPWYGLGLSERRFGHFLHNKERENFILSTKVGRVLKATSNIPKTMWHKPSPFEYEMDYTAAATRRSVEDSLQRLGLSNIDIVYIKQKRERITAIAKAYGTDLRTAALQFSSAPAEVGAVIPGASSGKQAAENVASMQTKIPSDFWRELKEEQLITTNAPIPT